MPRIFPEGVLIRRMPESGDRPCSGACAFWQGEAREKVFTIPVKAIFFLESLNKYIFGIRRCCFTAHALYFLEIHKGFLRKYAFLQ